MLHQFKLVDDKYKYPNIVKKMLASNCHQLFQDYFHQDLVLKTFLEQHANAASFLSSFFNKMNEILAQRNYASREIKATGHVSPESDVFLCALRHMLPTKGYSMINYLKENKGLAQHVEDHIEKLSFYAQLYAIFKNKQQQKPQCN
jgi:hypothetical protein